MGERKIKESEPIGTAHAENFIFIKANNKIHKLNFEDIFYVEAYGDYVKIHLKNKQIVSYSSLKNIAIKEVKAKTI